MDNLFETPETVSIRYIVNDVKACVEFYTELADPRSTSRDRFSEKQGRAIPERSR